MDLAEIGVPFAFLTDLVRAMPGPGGVEGAAPDAGLRGVGLVAPAGDCLPDAPVVGVFFGIVAIVCQLYKLCFGWESSSKG